MEQFKGFEQLDFCNLLYQDKPQCKTLEKLDVLAESLKKKLEEKGLHLFESKEGWRGFHRIYKKYECFELAHFSIFLGSSDNTGLWIKLHVGRGPDLYRLRRKVKSQPQRFEELLERLNNLSEKSDRWYEITFAETKPIGVRKTEWASSYSVNSGYVNEARVQELTHMMETSKTGWFNLYYQIPPSDAVAQGKEIVSTLLAVIEDWWAIYQFIVEE